MVNGLDKFASHFEPFKEFYVLIGGAACDLWLTENSIPFRRTKDLDIVIIVEAITDNFFNCFWAFIQEGHYESIEQSNQRPEFYRFYKPRNEAFPYMIELLTRNHLNLPEGIHLTPIPADNDISSLSAILLDDDYYRYVVESRQYVNTISLVPTHCLIPLKARAWIDLSRRKSEGMPVDSNDIKKHRNDVFRLYLSLAPADRFELPQQLATDLRAFLTQHPPESEDWKNICQAIKTELDVPKVLVQLHAIFML